MLSRRILKRSISIHALRKESDVSDCITPTGYAISIHALRKESDPYPRAGTLAAFSISIHALRKESDPYITLRSRLIEISIHALRKESDIISCRGVPCS